MEARKLHRNLLSDVIPIVLIFFAVGIALSLAQALRVHSDAMRSTRRLKAEEMAAKLPVKLLFPLIFFIFPSMFIVLIGPACIQMVRVLFPAMNGQ